MPLIVSDDYGWLIKWGGDVGQVQGGLPLGQALLEHTRYEEEPEPIRPGLAWDRAGKVHRAFGLYNKLLSCRIFLARTFMHPRPFMVPQWRSSGRPRPLGRV
jgi:hypothetical protein